MGLNIRTISTLTLLFVIFIFIDTFITVGLPRAVASASDFLPSCLKDPDDDEEDEEPKEGQERRGYSKLHGMVLFLDRSLL